MNRISHVSERRALTPANLGYADSSDAARAGVAGIGLASNVIGETDYKQSGVVSEWTVAQRRGSVRSDSSSESAGALAAYLQMLGRIAELTEAEEAVATRQAKLGSAAERETLIRANLRAVVRIARRYVNLGLPLMDLIGEGNLGLMLAVDRYDPVAGTRFIAYASFWIRRQIRLALSNQSRLIRLPVQRQNDLRAINAAAAELGAVLGRNASIEEIALAAALPVARVRTVLRSIPKILSLDAPHPTDESSSFADSLRDENATDPAEALVARETTDTRGLDDAINQLKPRDRDVICARFGLAGGSTMTLAQLARRMNLTCEGVRQIQSRALRKLRRQVRMHRLTTAVTATRKFG